MKRSPSDQIVTDNGTPQRNWWKIAFFAALLALELLRELLVIISTQSPDIYVKKWVFAANGYASAEGQWLRVDGGKPLIPTLVTVECRQERGICIEASTHPTDDFPLPASVDIFDARFDGDTITYVNNYPTCVRYDVRFDTKLLQLTAVRERKANASQPACAANEPRIEMQLSDSPRVSYSDNLKGHFVPFLSILNWAVNL